MRGTRSPAARVPSVHPPSDERWQLIFVDRRRLRRRRSRLDLHEMRLLGLLALAVDGFAVGLHLLLLLLLLPERLAIGVHDSEIVLGVLVEVFRRDAIARRLRLTG